MPIFFLSPTKNSKSSSQSQRAAPESHPFIKFRRPLKYLANEKRIKAITVLFSDLEGRLHMLDYDKKFLSSPGQSHLRRLPSAASPLSGKATSARHRLGLVYWAPADYFGSGKVLVSGSNRQGWFALFRRHSRRPQRLCRISFQKRRLHAQRRQRIEGFLFKGPDAERHITKWQIRITSTLAATTTRSPAIAPHLHRHHRRSPACHGSRMKRTTGSCAPKFEINYSYSEVVNAADQIQLYK